MMRYALRFALPGSILLACLWAGLMFRYDMQVWGGTVMVHDRWFGTVERCVGGGGKSSICLPVLEAGMQPIQRFVVNTPSPQWTPAPEPTATPEPKPKHRVSDEEFKALMDRDEELYGKPPQGSQ